MATVLSILQSCCKRIQLPVPTTVLTNTDPNVVSLLEFATKTARDLKREYEWPEFSREFTWTLSSGQAAYPMPPDLDHLLFETMWNRANFWPLIGPLTAQEWQYRKSGIISTSPRNRYRIKGWSAAGNFFIDPTPGTPDANAICVFEYQSSSWIRPASLWTTATSYTGGAFDYYGGNIYQSQGIGGTSGANPPVHNTGTASDGGVNWSFVGYDAPQADTDVVLFQDPELIINGAIWQYRQAKGHDWQPLFKLWQSAVEQAITNIKGARRLDMACPQGLVLIGPWSVPDTGFGG